MSHIGALENHRFRRKLVQTRCVHFDAAIASECIRPLLIGQKENEVWLSLGCHHFCSPTKSVLASDCNGLSVAVSLWAIRMLPTGKRLQEHAGFLKFHGAAL